jgi:hypothetical protein
MSINCAFQRSNAGPPYKGSLNLITLIQSSPHNIWLRTSRQAKLAQRYKLGRQPTKLAALALMTPTKFASLVLAECLILCLASSVRLTARPVNCA